MMTRGIVLVTCLLIVAVAFGQTTKKESTIIGDVVDVKSFVAYGMKVDNADRKAAAQASMQAGNPLGVLEKGTGKIYLVVSPNQGENANTRLADYLGMRVYVKGTVHRKNGIQLVVMSDLGKTIK